MDVAQLGFQIDSRQAVQASRNLDQMGAAAGRAQTATERMVQEVSQTMRRLDAVTRTAATALGSFFAVQQASQFAASLGRVADQYANIQARIRLATTSTVQYAQANEAVFAIAQRTFSTFDATSTLVARTTRALVSNGAAASDALNRSLALSETIQQAFAVSGATVQEASNAIIQLSQGLAAGALRGEEFNSIAEQGPRIMQALAASLGVTTGELRAMAMEGKLTAEVIEGALSSQAGVIAAEFEKLPMTIERSLTIFRNEWTKFVGELDQATGASQAVAESIAVIGRSIGPLTDALGAVAVAIGLAFGGRSLAAIGAYAGEVVKAVAAKSAMIDMERLAAAEAVKSTAATLAQAQAEEARIASQLRVVQASVATAEAQFATANAATMAAQRQYDAAKSAGALSFALRNVRDAEENLAAATRTRAQAYGSLAALDRAQVRIQGELAAATAATTAATTAQTAAAARSAAALTGMQAAMAAVSAAATRAGAAIATVFTALGGWFTVGLAAVYGLYQLGDALVNGSSEAQSNAAALDQLSDSMARTRQESALLAAGVAQGALGTAAAVKNVVESINELRSAQVDSGEAFGFAADVGPLRDAAMIVDAFVQKINDASIEEQTNALNRFMGELGASVATAENADQAIQEAVTTLQAAGVNTDGLAERLQWLNATFGQTRAAAESAAAGVAPFGEETQKLVDRIRAQTETIGLAGAQLIEYQKGQALAAAVARGETMEGTLAIAAQYDALIAATAAQDAATKTTTRAAPAIDKAAVAAEKYADRLKEINTQNRLQRSADGAGFLAGVRQLGAALQGPVGVALQRYNDQMEEATRLQFEGAISTEEARYAMALFAQELERAKAEQEAMSEEAQWMQSILDEFNNTGMQGLVNEIERVGEALKTALNPDEKEALAAYMQRLQNAALEYRQQGLETMIGASQQVLGSIQSMTEQGSKEYKALEVASHALNVALAVGAILNQGKGDPYTAFARMAAMATAVAGLVGSIGGSFGGSNGFTDTAAERQATQGRGTVLGDSEAQSQSILNAMEITADATSELVGINRGMLNALQALQGGLDRAGGMLARGAGQAEFTGVGGRFDVGGAFLGGLFGSLATRVLDPLGILGGSSRVTDQGLMIGGGGINDVGVQAYQEQQYRRWRFGSRRTREDLQPVGAEFESQFQLVVDSIVETVRQGALALGMLPADVEAALAAFRLEEIRISLKDLSAEEQQAELLAVFSSIFDNLAGSVVPFVEQFQRVGEGLGETLVRVATSVQVTQEAMTRLGFSLGSLDPETFAQISVGLIEMAGGIEEFASGMRTFMDNFAPESHRLAIAQNDLTRAFAEVGLTVPATREGMWELMQSLDATTEAGQRQIATLLRLAGTADSYYSMLENSQDTELQDRIDHLEELLDANRAYYDFAEGIAQEFARTFGSDLSNSLIEIEQQYRQNVRTANELARAAGMAGAAERDLARIELIAARQRAEAIRVTEDAARALAGELGLTELSQIDAQIAAFETAAQGMQAAIGGVSDAFDEAAQRAKQSIDLLIGDLSPLRDQEKLQIALQGLRAGTVSADQVLQIGRRLFASGNDYRQLFDQVLEIQRLAPINNDGGGSVGGGGGPAPVNPDLQRLIDRRNEIEAQEAQRVARTNAIDLVEKIAELARVQGMTFDQIGSMLGIDLAGLAEILGVDRTNLDEMLQRQSDEAGEIETAVLDMPELFADAVKPITIELAGLREQVADLIVQIGTVATNTGRTADATEGQQQTTATRDLIDTSGASRSTRQGTGNLRDNRVLVP